MRAACGCLVEDGMTLHGYDGPCAEDRCRERTDEDVCGEGGHAYYGDEFHPGPRSEPGFDEAFANAGRCYCGARRYPFGGLASEEGTTPR